MIVIVNYGVGNLKSILKALHLFTEKVEITLDKEKIKESAGIVLPGVGAFKTAMEKLCGIGIDKVIKDTHSPVLGICLGMQLFARRSEEGNCKGLGIFEEKVRKLPKSVGKIPHMGWNVVKVKRESKILEGIEKYFYAYFVHSYYLKTEKYELASTLYGIEFSSAVESENFFGFQFHPEKSGKNGLKIIKNFVKLCSS